MSSDDAVHDEEPIDLIDDVESAFADIGADDQTDPNEGLSELEIERNTAIAERDQFKDIALRLQADFENYRKRISAQQGDEVDRATGRVAESLLAVLDACEAAFAHGVIGVEPIWSQLMGVMQKQGLEALDLADKPFDPALADAVLHEEGDATNPIVSEVLRTGYMWKGRVLRAAMVKVRG